MANLFDDRQKKKKNITQENTQNYKGSGSTASSSLKKQYGSFSNFFEARRQEEQARDYQKWGEQAQAKRAAINGAIKYAQENRGKAINPVLAQREFKTTANKQSSAPTLMELADAAVAKQRETDARRRFVSQAYETGVKANNAQRYSAVSGQGLKTGLTGPMANSRKNIENSEAVQKGRQLKDRLLYGTQQEAPKVSNADNLKKYSEDIPRWQRGQYEYKNDPEAETYIRESFKNGNQVSPYAYAFGYGSDVLDNDDSSVPKWIRDSEWYQNSTAKDVLSTITPSKDDINAFLSKGFQQGMSDADRKSLSLMSEDQQKEYSYILGKYGKERAQAYLDAMKQQVNYLESQQIYNDWNNKGPVTRYAQALTHAGESGLEQFAKGTGDQFANAVAGGDDLTQPSAEALAYQQIRDGYSGPAGLGLDLVQNATMMAPTQVVSAAAALFTAGGSVLPEIVGLATTIAPMTYGNAYEEAKANGASTKDAQKYAFLEALNEAGGEFLLGGLEGASSGFTKNLAQNMLGDIANRVPGGVVETVARATGHFLSTPEGRYLFSMGSEGFEEIVQGTVENYLKNSVLGMDESLDPFSQENLYSALVAALSVGLNNAPYYINARAAGRNIDINAADLRAAAGNINASEMNYLSNGELDPDAYQAAQAQRDRLTNAAEYLEHGGTLTNAEKADLASAIMNSYSGSTPGEEIANERIKGIDELSKDLGETGAAVFKEQYGNAGTKNLMDYNNAFKMLYNAARAGDKEALALARHSDAAWKLSYQQQSAAISAGVADAMVESRRTNGQETLRSFEETEAVRLPESVRKSMINAYNGDVRMDAYQQAYKRAFVAGENGVSLDAAKRSPLVTTYLNRSQFEQAYKAGADLAGVVNNPAFKNGSARNGGLTYADKSATKAQKKIAKWVGNKTGLSVEIREDIKGGAEIDMEKGVLRINPKSKNFNQSVSHELTHLIRQYDNKGYKTYRKLVIDALMTSREQSYDELYAQYESAYGETGTTPNVDDVIEEMVADGAGQFLNDEEFINKIVNEDRSLAEKIIDFLSGIVDALKETMSQENLRATSKAVKEKADTYELTLNTWMNALTNASEAYQSGLTVENNASGESSSNTKYSLPQRELNNLSEYDKKNHQVFKDVIADYQAGNYGRGDLLVMDTTPYMLRMAGLGNKPIFMTKRHFDDAISPENPSRHTHGLSVAEVEEAPILLNRPAIIADSDSRNDSVVVISNSMDGKNRPIIMALQTDGKGHIQYNPVESNFMTSMYGRNGFDGFVNRLIGKGKILYINKKRCQDIFGVLRVQFPSGLNISGYNKIIHPSKNIVNTQSTVLNTDSNGKVLTNEQVEYFKNSKIVDSDGRLKIMYHGTPKGDFTVFKKAMSGTSTDYGWYGKGFYFTDKERVAKYYAGYLNSSRVMEVYLNMENPFELHVPKGENIQRVMADVMGRAYDDPDEQSAAFTKYVLDKGYDGIISDGQYIVFEPNQIKNVSNQNPTSNEDIRYQIEHPEVAKDTGVYNKNGDMISKDDMKYSLETFDSVGRENLAKHLQKEVDAKTMTKETADRIKDQMEWAYRLIQRYSNSGEYPMFSAWQTAEYKVGEDGTPVFSVVVPNGDYNLNMDFTTVCKKRDTLDQVLTALAKNGDLNYKKLNQAQISKINQIIKSRGFEIACSTCFVDSKRYNISNWAHSLTDGTKSRKGYNEAIASMLNDKVGAAYFNYVSVSSVYKGKPVLSNGQKVLSQLSNKELLKLNPHAFDYINDRMAKLKSNTFEYRMLKSIKDNPHMRSFLNPNDFISSLGQDIIQEQNPELHALINSLGGSSRPKPSHGRVAYYSEILNDSAFTPEAAYAVGGVRVQSFSDYMANMVFDYMQMIGDMAAKKLPSHAYTKEPMFAKMYGLTGMKINMSIMPKAIDWTGILDIKGLNIAQQAVKIAETKKGLTKKQISQIKKYAGLKMTMDEKGNFTPMVDEKGNYIPIVDDETFPMEEALAIRSAEGYKENCGTIWIGTSDAQIRTLLNMEEADMVIPYHKSSLNPAVAEMRNIEYLYDYTRQQRTRQRTESGKLKAIPQKNEFDFYGSLQKTQDGRKTADEYLAWCDEHGYVPKFNQFRDEKNYYKLLEDFRLYDGETSVMQKAVDTVYPDAGSAFGSFEDLMRENLNEANKTAKSLGNELPGILEQIRQEFGLTNTKQLRKQLDLDDSYNQNIEGKGFNVNYEVNSRGNITIDPNSYINDATWKKIHNAINGLGYGMPTIESTKKYVLGGYPLQPDQTKAVSKILGLSKEADAPHTDIETAKKIASKAARRYGTTNSFRNAAYLTVNGSMLDFSEGQGYRTMDHRSISEILDLPEDAGYSDGMIEFMNQGNIRMQTYGVDLSVAPNAAQRKVLTRFIQSLNGEFVLDISSESGNTIASIEYDEGTRASKILADIDRYFKEGIIPEQNDLMSFHTRYQLNPDYAPTFYSKLQNEIQNFKGEKIGATSVESYLKGKGVKDEEIKWSGIRTFLEGKKSVSKSELMDYLKANELVIGTKTLSAKQGTKMYESEDGALQSLREIKAGANRWMREMEYASYKINEFDESIEINFYDEDGNEMESHEVKAVEQGTHWSEYKLPYGKNYREILFKMPDNEYLNKAMNTHWGEGGVLAHARVQDFNTSSGEKVLFVEEIQSDWHNAGQKYGYGEDNAKVKRQKYLGERKSAVREALLKAFEKKDVDMFLSDKREHVAAIPHDKYFAMLDVEDKAEMKWNTHNTEKFETIAKASLKAEDAPDAPFHNNYTDFVLKDLLRMAAEGDYDYLAWTPASMQMERWNPYRRSSNELTGSGASDDVAFEQGYKIEYDQEIPKFLKKYGKQWGASVRQVGMELFSGRAGAHPRDEYVPAIEVNNAMKKSVLYEGQPMYQLDFDDQGTGFESDDVFNDNQDIISASEALGKILSSIDEKPSKKIIADTAVMVRRETGTNVGLETIKDNLNSLYDYLAFNRNIDGADISHIAADLVGEYITDSKAKINPVDKEVYDDFRNKVKTYTFHMPKGFEGEVATLGGVGALRREFFGTLNITNDKGSTIDQMWTELCDIYPEYFSKDVINPADQLEQLVEITRSLKPNPNLDMMTEQDYEVFRYSMGQDILKAFVEGGKNAAMREQYEQKLDKGLKKAREKVRKQKEKAQLRKLDREARTKLLTTARKLAKTKGGPEFEQQKQELIGDLDLIAKGIRQDTKAKLKSLERQATELAAKDDNYKKLYFDNAREVFSRLHKKHIKDMTGAEVDELTNKIVELLYQEQMTKRMLNEQQGIMAATVARRGISQQEYAKGINERNIIGSTLGRIGLNMLNPTRAFQKIDGYQNHGVFAEFGKQLNDGQTKMNTFMMNANKKFNSFLDEHPDLVKTWSTADIDTGFKDKEGKPVYINKGMRISLYLHNMNKQNGKHIAEGGIKIPDAKLYNKGKYETAYRYGTRIILKPTDIDKITSKMTKEEIEFATLVHSFLNTDTKNAINETSLLLSGTMKAMVENYFPIKTDPNFTRKEIDALVMNGTIEGMGMLKERTGSSNPVLLEDVAQVLMRQIENTGKYYGLAIPVRDFNKVYNFGEVGYAGSVKDSIYTTWGRQGLNYIDDVITHLQAGTPAEKGPGANIFNSMKGIYASTVLNWNLGVAIKQSASAPFAAVVLDAKSVAKAMSMKAISKADYEYMDSITPWSYMRRQGMSGTEMGEVYKQRSVVENSKEWQKLKQKLNWIQMVDVWTTDRLFFATEFYVQDHYPDLEVRSDAYNKKVAELYNDMLQRTQPSYEVMQRNAYLRSGNALAKVMGMFKTQTFNMGGEIIDSWSRMWASKRLLKDGRISEAQANKAKAQFGKTVAATVVSQMMLTALSIVAKALMHTMKDYRDDKGEVTAESVAARGIYEFLTSFAGMGMGGNELQSYLLSLAGKEKWYDIAYPGLAVVNDLVSSSVDVTDAFRKAMENGWDADSVSKLKKKIAEFTMNAAIVGKIPADNIYKIANLFWLHYQDIKNGMFGSFDSGEGLFGLKDSSVSKAEYAKQAIYEYGRDNTKRAEYALGKTKKEQLEDALGAVAAQDENGDTIRNSKRDDALLKIGMLDISDDAKLNLITTMYPTLEEPEKYLNASEYQADFLSRKNEASKDGKFTGQESIDIIMDLMSDGMGVSEAEELFSSTLSGDEQKNFDTFAKKYDDIETFFDLYNAKSEGKQEAVITYLKGSKLDDTEQRDLWAAMSYSASTFDKKVKK